MRPQLKIEKEPVDVALEIVGYVAIAAMIILPILYWGALPEVIPSHFNIKGEPDDYASRYVVWSLPAIGTILYLLVGLLTRIPHKFNYPVTITEDNAEQQYRMAARLVRVLNTAVAIIFAFLTYTMIKTGLQEMAGPGRYFTIVFLALVLALPICYIALARRNA